MLYLPDFPLHATILFLVTVVLALLFVVKSSTHKAALLLVVFVLLIQPIQIVKSGFLDLRDTLPPRFIVMVLPAIIALVFAFTTKMGKRFINGLDLKLLTLLHVIRVPVEISLWLIFTAGFIPEVMTFEGRNFDILAGLTAPFIWYFGYVKQKISPKAILIWNIVSLLLLVNIIVTAILSAPSPFQQFGLDQPNIAILYWPMCWLPSFVVPVVVLSHIAAIRSYFIQK